MSTGTTGRFQREELVGKYLTFALGNEEYSVPVLKVREIIKIMALPDMKERLATIGFDTIASTPEEYAAEIDAEETKWSAIVKSLNLKIE